MPFVSKKQAKWMFANKPQMAKEWASKTPSIKALPNKKKIKISVNNKMKGSLGSSEFKKGNIPTGKIQINIKAHKKDKKELASTIKHELLHVKHPKMTEKEVYKKSKKTAITPQEQSKLLAKINMKNINQKMGGIKRKFKMGDGETKPGDMINKMNESKSAINSDKSSISKTRLSILGLV